MPEQRLSIPSGANTLEGVLHLPEGGRPFPAVVVCHPHPQYGGDMHNNVVTAVVHGLTARGVAALRFNFRGVGASGGMYEGGKGEQDDARAALAHAAALPELDGARIGLAGYSFGAAVAAAAADASVPALALVALPIGIGPDVGERLAAYPYPLLLIAGDGDHVCPAAALQQLAAELGERAELRIVPGTDHFWVGHERELEQAAGDFFATHLKC
jgi:alpha/beta superfamily hydrolase